MSAMSKIKCPILYANRQHKGYVSENAYLQDGWGTGSLVYRRKKNLFSIFSADGFKKQQKSKIKAI